MHVPLHLQKKATHVAEALSSDAHFSRELTLIFASRTLQRIALSAMGVFVPIFFLKTFNGDLEIVVTLFVAMYMAYVLAIPIGARLLYVLGTRPMMLLATLFVMLSSMALYLVPDYPVLGIAAYLVFVTLYRAVYWIPYYVDLSHSLDKKHRGAQLAFLLNTMSLLLAFVPLIGGVLITAYGFPVVFALSSVVLLLSGWPLLYAKNSFERYSWGYLDTFFHLFQRENRTLVLAHAANGAQGGALLVFWPIYLFLIFKEQYTVLGVITTLTLIALLFLRSFTGWLFDKWNKTKVIALGALVTATGWGLKLFVNTPIEVFIVDTYHNVGQSMNAVSFDAITYEQAADSGRFVDEYTALKEMALSLGRVVMLLVVGVLLMFFDMRVSFILAAFITLAMVLIGKKASIQ